MFSMSDAHFYHDISLLERSALSRYQWKLIELGENRNDYSFMSGNPNFKLSPLELGVVGSPRIFIAPFNSSRVLLGGIVESNALQSANSFISGQKFGFDISFNINPSNISSSSLSLSPYLIFSVQYLKLNDNIYASNLDKIRGDDTKFRIMEEDIHFSAF